MNERIKELYIQTANETADGKEWAIGGLLNAKRFAELILLDIRELIQEEAYVNKVVMVDVVLGQLLHAIEERFNG